LPKFFQGLSGDIHSDTSTVEWMLVGYCTQGTYPGNHKHFFLQCVPLYTCTNRCSADIIQPTKLCLQNKVLFPVSVMFILMHSNNFRAAAWVLVFQCCAVYSIFYIDP